MPSGYRDFHDAFVSSGKLKEWSLVTYGTSLHPYSSLRSEKPRSTDEEFTEEYNGESGVPNMDRLAILAHIAK